MAITYSNCLQDPGQELSFALAYSSSYKAEGNILIRIYMEASPDQQLTETSVKFVQLAVISGKLYS